MARKSKKELEQIKKDYKVSELWSWSKYHKSVDDLFGYYLNYIQRQKEDRQNSIYGVGGGCVHDLMEQFYNGTYKEGELKDVFVSEMIKFNTLGYKFDRNNKEKNDAISFKYNYCNEHFLDNFNPIIGTNIELEKFILIKVSKFLFQGYSDFTHEEIRGGVLKKVITDFKTSSIYTGDKIIGERGQLLLYALGEIQNGWNTEDVIIRWLFTKYVNVKVPNKDSFRIRKIGRNEIGSKLKASVKKELKNSKIYDCKQIESMIQLLEDNKNIEHLSDDIKLEVGDVEFIKNGSIKKTYISKVKKCLESKCEYEENDIEFMLEEMILMNSLDGIPKNVKDKFEISDCFVEIPFDKEDIKQLQVDIVTQIVDVKRKEIEYNKNKDDKVFWNEINSKNEYFYNVLSGYSRKYHKPYNEYLKLQEDKKKDNGDLLSNNKDDDLDMDSLFEELGIELG